VSEGNANQKIITRYYQKATTMICRKKGGWSAGEALEAVEYLLQHYDDLVHGRSFFGVVSPHAFHQVDQFGTPLSLESFR